MAPKLKIDFEPTRVVVVICLTISKCKFVWHFWGISCKWFVFVNPLHLIWVWISFESHFFFQQFVAFMSVCGDLNDPMTFCHVILANLYLIACYRLSDWISVCLWTHSDGPCFVRLRARIPVTFDVISIAETSQGAKKACSEWQSKQIKILVKRKWRFSNFAIISHYPKKSLNFHLESDFPFKQSELDIKRILTIW